MAKPTPALSLSTILHRPTIAIDGTAYELRTADEMPWLAYRGHANKFLRAGELMQVRKRTATQERQLEALLVELIEAIVLAPKKVLDRLNTVQRFEVLMVFSSLLPTKGRRPAGATPRRSAMTIGAK